MKHTIVLTAPIPLSALQILSQECDVISHLCDGPRTEEEMIQIFAEADGVIALVSDPITRQVLASNPNLRIVAIMEGGTDNVDLEAAVELGIQVTNQPGSMTELTEEARGEMATVAVMNVLSFFRTGQPLNRVV
ncbi:MAG TPA: hypothetical protein VNM92_01770 [Thermoanaerobaculia bacterium]|nr:hypothetical protein [Thermoanaerobaculia bacterium]